MKKMGRPNSENPKERQITIRLDKDGVELLDYCCMKANETKSQVLRKGLELYSNQIKGEMNGKEYLCNQ